MKLNKKGYMLVEIILASALAFGLAFFIIDLVIRLKNKNNDLLVETLITTDKTIITNKLMSYAQSETKNFDCNKLTITGNTVKYKDEVIDIITDYANVGELSCSTVGGKVSITIPVSVSQTPDKDYDITFDYKYEIGDMTPPTCSITVSGTTITGSYSDSGGSGVAYYGYSSSMSGTSSATKTINSTGTYTFYVKDVAGNITTDTIKVENIDSSIPATPVITPSDGRSQDKWHTADFTLAFSSQIENSKSTITYYFGTSKNNLVLIGNEVAINSSYSRKTIYVKACNEAKMCSGVSSYTVLYDNTAPTYTSGGSIGRGSVSKPSYTDNAGGSGNVTVYTCVTTGKVPTNTDSCFSSSQTTYSYSCGTTFRLYSYAVDAAGNKSAVYDHATNNGATYYNTCYSGGGSSYGGGGSSGGSSGGRSHSSSCDTSCQMKQNSEAWHNTTNQAERDRLHRENQKLAEKNNSCGSGCSFDSGSGNWKNSSGKNLYEVSGGKKK